MRRNAEIIQNDHSDQLKLIIDISVDQFCLPTAEWFKKPPDAPDVQPGIHAPPCTNSGNRVVIKNNVQIWDGITIEDNEFYGKPSFKTI